MWPVLRHSILLPSPTKIIQSEIKYLCPGQPQHWDKWEPWRKAEQGAAFSYWVRGGGENRQDLCCRPPGNRTVCTPISGQVPRKPFCHLSTQALPKEAVNACSPHSLSQFSNKAATAGAIRDPNTLPFSPLSDESSGCELGSFERWSCHLWWCSQALGLLSIPWTGPSVTSTRGRAEQLSFQTLWHSAL